MRRRVNVRAEDKHTSAKNGMKAILFCTWHFFKLCIRHSTGQYASVDKCGTRDRYCTGELKKISDKIIKYERVKLKKGKYIVLLSLAMIIVILGAYLYKYYPFFEAYYYNRYISVDKIKLLMSENELNKVLDYEGEFVHGMGGDGWDYKDIKVFVMTSSIGMFKNKVVSIDTENPSHSVLGISVGDDYSASVDIIKKNGFSEIYEGIFAKGNIYIQLFGETQISRLRIRIQDPKYRNAVF